MTQQYSRPQGWGSWVGWDRVKGVFPSHQTDPQCQCEVNIRWEGEGEDKDTGFTEHPLHARPSPLVSFYPAPSEGP